MPFPTFLVIGANKAGTTSLNYYLHQHPDIFMSRNKEPMFFIFDGKEIPDTLPDGITQNEIIVNNIDDYKRLFSEASDEMARGECSTAYLRNSYIAERIKRYIPSIKLICILRNPIERAYSGYRYFVGKGIEKRTFKAAIVQQMDPKTKYYRPQAYLELGKYANHVERYLSTFGESQMKIYLYKDWCETPESVLRDIYQFIEVDPKFQQDTSRRHNVSDKNDRGELYWQRVSQFSLIQLLPKEYSHLVEGIMKTIFNRTQLTYGIRNKLIRYYYDDVKKLEGIICRDLSHWLR